MRLMRLILTFDEKMENCGLLHSRLILKIEQIYRYDNRFFSKICHNIKDNLSCFVQEWKKKNGEEKSA